MLECNNCKTFKCDVPRRFRQNKSVITTEDMQKSCTSATKPKPWTNKLIDLALTTSPQGVYQALYNARLRLQELDRKPWFRLILMEGE